MKVQCIVFILSAFLLSLGKVASFKCYVCTSENDTRCTQLDPPTSLPTQTCSDHKNYEKVYGLVPNCYKSVSKQYIDGKEKVTVIRKCTIGNSGQTAKCHVNNLNGEIVECYCPDPFCNGKVPFECYECTSENNPQCTELGPPASLPKQICTGHENLDKTLVFVPNCLKYVSKHYVDGKEKVKVIRKCAIGYPGKQAFYERDESIGGLTYLCPDLLCNGATPSNSHLPYTLLVLGVLGSVLVAYLHN